MQSNDLSEFHDWLAWPQAVSQAPVTPGVYIFRLVGSPPIGRLRDSSDVVYVGSSGNVQRRLTNHGRRREDLRDIGYLLSRVTSEVGKIEVAWKPFEDRQKANWHEMELLRRYCRDHIELPPLNCQQVNKKVSVALSAMKSLKPDERARVLTASFRNGG